MLDILAIIMLSGLIGYQSQSQTGKDNENQDRPIIKIGM